MPSIDEAVKIPSSNPSHCDARNCDQYIPGAVKAGYLKSEPPAKPKVGEQTGEKRIYRVL